MSGGRFIYGTVYVDKKDAATTQQDLERRGYDTNILDQQELLDSLKGKTGIGFIRLERGEEQ